MIVSFMILCTYIAFRLIFALIMLVAKFLAIDALRIWSNGGKYFRVTVSQCLPAIFTPFNAFKAIFRSLNVKTTDDLILF